MAFWRGGQHGYWVGWATLVHHSRRSARAGDGPCGLGGNPFLVSRSWFVSLDRELASCPRGYPFSALPVLYGYPAISGSIGVPGERAYARFRGRWADLRLTLCVRPSASPLDRLLRENGYHSRLHVRKEPTFVNLFVHNEVPF